MCAPLFAAFRPCFAASAPLFAAYVPLFAVYGPCFAASGFPDLSHQDENRPLTHFLLLIYHIRKSLTCLTGHSVALPCFPDVSHQEEKRHSTHFWLLIYHIRKLPNCIFHEVLLRDVCAELVRATMMAQRSGMESRGL